MDPAWLLERKYGGPSEEALKVLDIKDPLVSFRLNNYKLANPNSNNNNNTLKKDTIPAAAADSSSIKKENKSNAASIPSLNSHTSHSQTSSQSNNPEYKYKYNSEFGLYSKIDPVTLLPVYHCEINTKQGDKLVIYLIIYLSQAHV